jgi:hypothetical protein
VPGLLLSPAAGRPALLDCVRLRNTGAARLWPRALTAGAQRVSGGLGGEQPSQALAKAPTLMSTASRSGNARGHAAIYIGPGAAMAARMICDGRRAEPPAARPRGGAARAAPPRGWIGRMQLLIGESSHESSNRDRDSDTCWFCLHHVDVDAPRTTHYILGPRIPGISARILRARTVLPRILCSAAASV